MWSIQAEGRFFQVELTCVWRVPLDAPVARLGGRDSCDVASTHLGLDLQLRRGECMELGSWSACCVPANGVAVVAL